MTTTISDEEYARRTSAVYNDCRQVKPGEDLIFTLNQRYPTPTSHSLRYGLSARMKEYFEENFCTQLLAAYETGSTFMHSSLEEARLSHVDVLLYFPNGRITQLRVGSTLEISRQRQPTPIEPALQDVLEEENSCGENDVFVVGLAPARVARPILHRLIAANGWEFPMPSAGPRMPMTARELNQDRPMRTQLLGVLSRIASESVPDEAETVRILAPLAQNKLRRHPKTLSELARELDTDPRLLSALVNSRQGNWTAEFLAKLLLKLL